MRTALLSLLTIVALQGCTASSAIQIAGAAAGAAMEAAGLRQPEARRDVDAARPLSLTLVAGAGTNAAADGSPLALVVRIYQLRGDSGFARMSYLQASDPDGERSVLQDDLVAVREITLIPGQTYRYDEQVPARVKVIGVVAQFRRPMGNRWKLAFDRNASEKNGITVAFHACAMTAAVGELADPAQSGPLRALTGVRCT